VKNNVGDLWSIMEFLNSGFLGSQNAFKRSFFIPIQANRDPAAAQRWIKVLEGFDIGERLNRGRTYARKGQVMDIEIEKGAVQATVQGSRSHPYKVAVRFRPLSRAQWRQVAKALGDRPG
jgi:uncharacterized Zn finger protein